MASPAVWVNGLPGGRPDPADRGLAFGDGLFETVRVIGGQPVLAERHWLRLRQGCARLGIALDEPLLWQEVAAFLASQGDGVLKIIVTRGAGGRGYLPPPAVAPTRILSWHEAPDYPPERAEEGIAAVVCAQPLGESPLLAGLKHLNRLEQVLLRQELEVSGAAEGLACTVDGRVIEGVFSNVFLERDGALLTPALERAGVAGVMRAELLAQAAGLGLTATEAVLTVADFLRADAAFFCNSIYGIWPVRGLAGATFPVGPLTRRLQGATAALFTPRA